MLNNLMDQFKDPIVDKKIYVETTKERLNFFTRNTYKAINW